MTILLDIDGVLETTPPWRQVEMHADGFMRLNENALENLSVLYQRTNASIVLTTTHRINYDVSKWKEIFRARGLEFETITKLNDKTEIGELQDRGTEIKEWLTGQDEQLNYVVLDDDLSILALPDDIKQRCVLMKPHIGFDQEALEKAISILIGHSKFACPCCGHKTFTEEPDGSYIICPVCFWEDDPVQFENPDFAGGANRTSLRQAQKNFMEFGACDESMKKRVRLPNDDEPKEDGWRPFD